MRAFTFAVRVYYEDTDFSGVVYHANYLRFFERARTEMLRTIGVSHGALHDTDEPLAFVVRSMSLDFAKPARMDDWLTVETEVRTIGGASIEMEQSLLRDSTVLVTASVRVACVIGGRAARLPADLRARLQRHEPPPLTPPHKGEGDGYNEPR